MCFIWNLRLTHIQNFNLVVKIYFFLGNVFYVNAKRENLKAYWMESSKKEIFYSNWKWGTDKTNFFPYYQEDRKFYSGSLLDDKTCLSISVSYDKDIKISEIFMQTSFCSPRKHVEPLVPLCIKGILLNALNYY